MRSFALFGTFVLTLGFVACARDSAQETPPTKDLASSTATTAVNRKVLHSFPILRGEGKPFDLGLTGVEHAWDTASTSGGPGFTLFECQFTVPDPPSFTGQSVFLWCGVQQASGVTPSGDSSFGVLQPVLMFGPDCIQELPQGQGFGPGNDPSYDGAPYWYYSAQYVFPNPKGSTDYQCTSGTVFKAVPGTLLVSAFTYDPTSDSMTVRMSTSSGNNLSTLTVPNPWDDSTQAWSQFLGSAKQIVLEGAVETWNLTESSQWPAQLLSGWTVNSAAQPLASSPFTNNDQWQLSPWDNGSLKVSCSHQSAGQASTCTWSK